MAALGITGVVVVARPPGLFPPEVIIIIIKIKMIVREDINTKKTFSFGHCPNEGGGV